MVPGLDPAMLQMLLQSAPPPPAMGGMPPMGMGAPPMDPMAMMAMGGGMPPGMPPMGMGAPPMDPMAMMAMGGGMPPGMPPMGMGAPPMDPMAMMAMGGGMPPIPPQFGPQGAAPPPGNQPIQPAPQPNELGPGEALNLPPNASLEETTKNIDSPDMSIEKLRGVNVSLLKTINSVDPEVGDLLTQASKLINQAIARKSGVQSVSVLSPSMGDGKSPTDEEEDESPFRSGEKKESGRLLALEAPEKTKKNIVAPAKSSKL